MDIFSKLGHYIIKLFSLIGTIILAIPKIPDKLRNFDSRDIKERIDTDNIKENISRIREDAAIDEKISRITNSETNKRSENSSTESQDDDDSGIIMIGGAFTAEEKERTVLFLQLLAALFIVLSILSIFNFISVLIYVPLGIVIIGYMIYLLYYRIKFMYKSDFNAYRDFFLMYIAVGIILFLVNNNSSLVMSFSFQLLPSLTVLIFAVVAVLAVFLIFRIRYYRNFTYGKVIEGGKNTAYVKVEYDIRSNVKPDIYIVENHVGAMEGETVKLQLEEKLLSMSGNRPISIIQSANRI
jgi:uncharacterized membrane protein